MKMIKLLGLLLILLTFVGCEDDPVAPSCTNYAVNLGPFYLKESTVNLFPYAKSDTNIVFKNALNEELVFTLSFLARDTFMYSFFDECPFDSTLQVPYVLTEEEIIADYRNDSLDIDFHIKFTASFSSNGDDVTGESDLAYTYFSRSFPYLSSLIAHKIGLVVKTNNNFYPSITLGTKTFDNVYSSKTIPNFPPEYIAYMNYEIGIVGFEVTSSGVLWTFDRAE